MDVITCYVCILTILLWLCCIAIICVVIDTVLGVKRYLNDKHYIAQENNTIGGGNNDNEI